MEKLKIKVKLEKHAKMPTRAFKTDAGYDLYSNQPYTEIKPGEGVSFRTGVHLLIPEGYCGLLVSKSGLNVRHVTVAPTCHEADNANEIIVQLYNGGERSYIEFKGDTICKMVIVTVPDTEVELSDSL